jgi:hypothetical protein
VSISVKRENECDHRLIRYLVSLPFDVNVTNPQVLKEYSEVLDNINIDIEDLALQQKRLIIDDIMSEREGSFAIVTKLRFLLQRLNSNELKIPTHKGSVILLKEPVIHQLF